MVTGCPLCETLPVGSGPVELLIIRHALPETEIREDAPADPPLSDLGHRQAAATAEFLVGEAVDAVVTSSMRRAIETSRPLAERLGLEVIQRADLVESDHRRGSYTPAEELDAEHEVVREFLDNPMNMFSDGYETFRDRIVAAFDELVASHRGATAAVFCHGMVTSVYLQVLLGIDDPFALMPDYCGITRVTASSSGIRTVRSANETGHLRHLT